MPKEVIMSSPASIGKHPIHPMLVAIPIGLWIFSLVSDCIAFFRGGDIFWSNVAFYTMVGGVVGALIAAVPGLIDWLSITNRKAKSIGLWHMLINLTVVGLFAGNIWLRMGNQSESRFPLALSVIGIILLGISGWLGGEMVFRHGVAVEPQHTPRVREGNEVHPI
jgi:uncharacterized membrane protein